MSAAATSSIKPPRFIMIAGFLGAGKTTCAARIGAHLRERGQRVAFITNDQGGEIVDTQILRSQGFATEHIESGSFSSRFDALTEAGSRLIEKSQPDVLIVEPVGSSADLVATVGNPLRQLNSYRLAPFSVVVDPARAARFFNLEPGGSFSDPVHYLYRKQLEEADFIVINKSDLVAAGAMAALRARIGQEFPEARALAVSARLGLGIDSWVEALTSGTPSQRPMLEVDYQKYGQGEALLGWLNCAAQISALKEFPCNPILSELAGSIQRDLRTARIEVAHLKMAVTPEYDQGALATLNLVRNDFQAELGEELPEPIDRGTLTLNLRAEGKPDVLHSIVTNALTHLGLTFPTLFTRLTKMEHFRPGHHKPTHRLAALATA